MKPLKILVTPAMVLLISIFIFSCSSNELSRAKAEQLIKEKVQYPKDLQFVKCYTVKGYGNGPQYAEKMQLYKEQLEKLQSEGLITFHSDNSHPEYTDFIVDFTDKGKQYLAGTPGRDDENGNNQSVFVKVGFLDFDKITGIVARPGFNITEVNYTEKVKDITPFGKVFNIPQEIFSRQATFTKFDDGWRITQ
jgi:hypothetical protein